MTLIEKIKGIKEQSSDEQKKEEVKNQFIKQAEKRKEFAELLKSKKLDKENEVNE